MASLRKPSSGSSNAASIIKSMQTSCVSIKNRGARVKVDGSTFLTVAFSFDELSQILTDLATKQSIVNGAPTSELLRLEAAVTAVLQQVTDVSQRSRVFLLLNSEHNVRTMQERVQEVGHCLNLVPVLSLMSSVSPFLHDKLADVRLRLRNVSFESEPGNPEVAKALNDGLQSRIDDQAYASGVLVQLLKQLNVQVAEVGPLLEEVKVDLAAAKTENRTADITQLQKLSRFLSQANAGADIRQIGAQSPAGLLVQKQLSDQAPENFKCNLTGQVMRDPVTLTETGVIYERCAIEDWFAEGNKTCPKTKKSLSSFALTPNLSLRKSIDEEFEVLNHKIIDSALASLTSSASPPFEAIQTLALLTSDKKFAQHVISKGGVTAVVPLIMYGAATPEIRDAALQVLAQLAAVDKASQELIVTSGAIPPLLKISEEDSPTSCAAALRVLNALAGNAQARATVTEAMGVILLIKLLKANRTEGPMRTLIEGVLEKFWRDDSYVAIQMASAGIFEPLVALLEPGNDIDTRLTMADAVMTWGVNFASRVEIVEAGVVPPLLDLLSRGPPSGVAAAARAFEHLSHTEANRIALAKGGVIPALVKARRGGSAEVQEAAAAILTNLAMDDQDLDALDEEGAIVRLIAQLRTENVSNREYTVRTLQTMVRDSRTMRSYVLEDKEAVPVIFETLKEAGSGFATSSVRSVTVLLLGALCQEPSASESMVAPPAVVGVLAQLLERPIPAEEREAVVGILSAMALNKSMHAPLCKEASVIPALAKCLANPSPKVKERAFIALTGLADTTDLAIQEVIAGSGALPLALHYARNGPDSFRIHSIKMFGYLSLSTPRILGKGSHSTTGNLVKGFASSLKLRGGSSANTPARDEKKLSGSTEKRSKCHVHSGKCSLDATYCLVEGEVLPILIELVEKADVKVGEACLVAITTLLMDKDDMERGIDYLVKQHNIIALAASLVGKTPSATEAAVELLERVFTSKKYRHPKYAQPAISALGRFLTTATGASRKAAADALMRLNILPRGSMPESI
eukprot:TRINITY_DN3207_c0_g2_i1.p1 TRINITY_DN3207_c0_g2~~TRINITY_DN3207_c0_g2_i1.p1  ORF type:complete len:1031 (-),score=121.13 TRINITY_DN3207_c0_g2_i1:912-4004(-)